MNAVAWRPWTWLGAAVLALAGARVLMDADRPYAAAEALLAGQAAVATALVSWVRGGRP